MPRQGWRFFETAISPTAPTPEDAEDAAQEALIVLYRKIGTLRAAAALTSWVFQIVRNECIRRSRLALRRVAPGMVALRGCPTCWIAGVIQTITAGRLQRTCTDTNCTLEPSHGELGAYVIRHEIGSTGQ
jgi:DNA-directed RNA polymerase specialized sigma24 family protein